MAKSRNKFDILISIVLIMIIILVVLLIWRISFPHFSNVTPKRIIDSPIPIVTLPSISNSLPIETPVEVIDKNEIVQKENWWSYPEEIFVIPIEKINIDTVLSKSLQLPPEYVPEDLVTIDSSIIRTVGSVQVRSVVVESLEALASKAEQDGIDLSVVSGYRSFQTQQSTYDYWLSQNGGNVDFVDKISARAGHSEHQLGTALDFSSSEVGDALGNKFNNSQTSIWLAENAPNFGFRLSYPAGKEMETGYNHEGWHYRWYGIDND